jgi:D-alanyl-D-alanine carboxypeptidase
MNRLAALEAQFDRTIPADMLRAALEDGAAFNAMTPAAQAAALVASQCEHVATDRRYILAILAKRRSARAEIAALSDPFRDANFVLLIRAKATLDAAERDARFQLKWYRSGRALLAMFRANLAAATAAAQIAP